MLAGTLHYPFTSSIHDLSVAKVRTILETCKVFRQFFAERALKSVSVDAEIFGDETDLAGGVIVAVAVPARLLLQRLHQLGTAVDVLTQFLHRRLGLPGMRRSSRSFFIADLACLVCGV